MRVLELCWSHGVTVTSPGQMTSLEVKAVVTLQEAVPVPPMPDITVPERFVRQSSPPVHQSTSPPVRGD